MAVVLPTLSLRRASMLGILGLVLSHLGMLAADIAAGFAASGPGLAALAVGVGRLAVFLAVLAALVPDRSRSSIAAAMLFVLGLDTIFVVYLNQARGDAQAGLAVIVVLTLAASVLLPWGARLQGILVAIQVGILAVGSLLVEGLLSSPVLVIFTSGSLVVSILLASELEASHEVLAAGAANEANLRREADELGGRRERTVRERTQSLAIAASELQELCRAVSHDLRPPLRTVAGYCDMLGEVGGLPESSRVRSLLDELMAMARGMAGRLDSMLVEVRRVHRRVRDDLVSLSEVARSEQEILAERAAPCRWLIDDDSLRAASSLPEARLLRALLRYVVLTGVRSGVDTVEVGGRQAGASSVCFVRTTGWTLDGEDRQRLASALDGRLPFSEVPVGMGEVVIAARTLSIQHGGTVWLESSGLRVMELCFQSTSGTGNRHDEDAIR